MAKTTNTTTTPADQIDPHAWAAEISTLAALADTSDELDRVQATSEIVLVTANGAAMRALDQAGAEVVGGRETMISRDLLAAVIRLQSCSTHVTSMVLSLVEERAAKG